MDEIAVRSSQGVALPITLRDAAMPIFRRRRLVLLVFTATFGGALLAALFVPRKYQAEMMILLNRYRADTVVTPDASAPGPGGIAPGISEEDVNSEVALLKSRDLLEQVVRVSDLSPGRPSRWQRFIGLLRGGAKPREAAAAAAEEDLEDQLIVEPLKKTNLIRVAYTNRNPQRAAFVLQNLAASYLEKHAAVHRPAGTFSFFDEQADGYRKDLAVAEKRLTDFDRHRHVVAADAQKQLVLQQLSQFQAELQEDMSSSVSAQERIDALRREQSGTPERQATQIRKLDNPQLLASLESTLLSLELKRSDMLMKYAPEYPPVREIEAEIANTRKTIDQTKQAPMEDITTDRVPAQDWIATELVKAEAERAEYRARAANAERSIREYEQMAEALDQKGATQRDLTRNVKTAEDNYLLYLRKREEARISDELDSKCIVNVSIAEAPTVPAFPTLRLGWVLIGGIFAASSLSAGAAYASDRLDPSFRTPDELSRYLDVNVLAAIPVCTPKQ